MAQHKDWEHHARKSRHSALLTFLGAAAVVGALLISFWQLTVLHQRIDDKQQQLSQIEAKIDSAKVELQGLLAAMADSVKNVSQGAEQVVQRNAGDVLARYNLLKKEAVADIAQFAKEDKKPRSFLKKRTSNKSQAAEIEPVESEAPSRQSAYIDGDDNFVLCRSIADMMPEGVAEKFQPGRVYMWARVTAPKNESLILRWVDENNKVLRTQYLRVKENTQTGFRIYDYKTFSDAQKGAYAVLLYNENGDLIARKTFSIS